MAAPADMEFLISEMVRPGAMAELIDDNFANYVVQTALDNAGPEQKQQMIKEIMPQLNTIKSRSWYDMSSHAAMDLLFDAIGADLSNAQGQNDTHPSASPPTASSQHPTISEPTIAENLKKSMGLKLPPHQCHICSKSYERLDHLNRHLKSRG